MFYFGRNENIWYPFKTIHPHVWKGNYVAFMIRTLMMVVSLSECQLISLFVGFWRLSNKNRSSLKTSSEVFGKSLSLRTVLSLKNGQESYSTTTTDTKARFAYHISLSFRKYTTNILSTQLSFSFCLMYWGRLGGLKRMIW